MNYSPFDLRIFNNPAIGSFNHRPAVRVRDNISTSLPTGLTVNIDGEQLLNLDRVLFTNLSDPSLNNTVYVVSGVGFQLEWAPAIDLGGRSTTLPSIGDTVFITQGNTYNNHLIAWTALIWEDLNPDLTSGNNSLQIDGTNSPISDISWAGFKLTNLGAPTAGTDASTKAYVDAAVAAVPAALHIDGSNSPLTNINWGGFKISNLANPTLAQDAATKFYVDAAVVATAMTSLTGDVTGTGPGATATTVVSVGGSSAASIHTSQLDTVAATALNTPSTIVKRDSSGNFAAGTITANITGNVSGSAASFTGVLAGNVTGTQGATVVVSVGGSSAANIHSAELAANAATSANTPSTIVKRDSSGDFSANNITANLIGSASNNLALNGSNSPSTNISWASHRLINLADPVNPQDAATKNYVAIAIAAIPPSTEPLAIHKDGSTSPTANINWAGFKITSLGAPTLGTDAANKTYVDNAVASFPETDPLSIHTDGSNPPTANISWNSHKITNLLNPTSPQDAATKFYIDAAIAALPPETDPLSIHKDGSTVPSANISWNNFRLIALATPINPTDAANKGYVDAAIAAIPPETDPLSIHKDGSTSPTANISWAGFKLTNLGAPTTANDATTKTYVDNAIATHPETDPLSIHLDGSTLPTANISFNGFKVTSIAAPTVGTDAANKTYVDSVVSGGTVTASNGLVKVVNDIQVAPSLAGSALSFSIGVLSVKFDNSTIDLNGSNQLEVKTGGISNAQVNPSAAIALTKLAALNPNIVPVTNGSGFLVNSATTATQLSYLDATSSIQTQLNTKLSTIIIGTFDSQAPAANGLVYSAGSLYAQSASATVPGMVNNIAQVFSGAKTLTGTLTMSAANINVGGNNVINVNALIASGSNPATGGIARFKNNDPISWRNFGNTANFSISLNTSNIFSMDTGLSVGGNVSLANSLLLNQAGVATTTSLVGITGTDGILVLHSGSVTSGGTIALYGTTSAFPSRIEFGQAGSAVGFFEQTSGDFKIANNFYVAKNTVVLNTAAAVATESTIALGATDGNLALSGGTSSSNGAAIQLFGATSAAPNQIRFLNNNVTQGYFDNLGNFNINSLTPSRALVSDPSNNVVSSVTTAAEIAFVSGATSSLQGQLNNKLNLSGGTMTGALNMGSNNINSLANPINPFDAATKFYVDNLAQGLSWKGVVRSATTVALPGYSYSLNVITANANGALPAQDGVTLIVGDRLLVKDETAGNLPYNGIYVVTQVGSGGSQFVLTRSSDANTAITLQWATVEVGSEAVTQAGLIYRESNVLSVIGTSPVAFTQISQGSSYIFTTALNLTGNTVSVIVDNSTIDVTLGNQLEVKTGGISNAQVNASAAISLSKLAALNANIIPITDASGFLTSTSGSDISLTSAAFLRGPSGSGTIREQYVDSSTLLDNSSAIALAALTFAHGSFAGVEISYTIQTGAGTPDVRIGTLRVTSNGTSTSITDTFSETADCGVTWTASISGLNTQILYTTSNQGTNRLMRADVKQFRK